MSTKSSQAALDAQATAEFFAASKRTYKVPTTEGLVETFGGLLKENETPYDWGFYQDLQIRLLDDGVEGVDNADRVRRDAVAGRKKARADVRTQVKTGRKVLDSVTTRISAYYGPEAVAAVGLDTPMAKKGLGLLQQLRHVRTRVRSALPELAQPLPGFEALDFEALARELDDPIAKLSAAIDVLNNAIKLADQALSRKKEALKELKRRNVNVARLMEAQYRLVGLDEAAERLRPFLGRRGKAAKPTEETAQQETEESTSA